MTLQYQCTAIIFFFQVVKMATIYVVFVTASIFLLFISMLPFNINEFFYVLY